MTTSSKIVLDILNVFSERGGQILHAYNLDSSERGWV